ncbi:hypothetical protein LOK49_LG04G00629 [Camellia lanceoleosa]|uniref:Uncharacterized protein n=1 Tax=Camellia lanceoleosa TaxID=1840588 RepID=A0ACC0I3E9_9ERIC|nr:hypothetical protein LOK49_LG04G00629 [Camellia lanceoleosa]
MAAVVYALFYFISFSKIKIWSSSKHQVKELNGDAKEVDVRLICLEGICGGMMVAITTLV